MGNGNERLRDDSGRFRSRLTEAEIAEVRGKIFNLVYWYSQTVDSNDSERILLNTAQTRKVAAR